jgi:hypothetical protein
LATWEGLEAVQHRFPRAPAWGQAVSLGWGRGGGVSKDTSKDIDAAPSEQANSKDREANGPTRAVRYRRPNSRVSDPEWVA